MGVTLFSDGSNYPLGLVGHSRSPADSPDERSCRRRPGAFNAPGPVPPTASRRPESGRRFRRLGQIGRYRWPFPAHLIQAPENPRRTAPLVAEPLDVENASNAGSMGGTCAIGGSVARNWFARMEMTSSMSSTKRKALTSTTSSATATEIGSVAGRQAADHVDAPPWVTASRAMASPAQSSNAGGFICIDSGTQVFVALPRPFRDDAGTEAKRSCPCRGTVGCGLDTFAGDVFSALAREGQRATAGVYVRGLMLDGTWKSMQPMALRLRVNHQRLQQFLTTLPWDMVPVRNHCRAGRDLVVPDALGPVGHRRHRVRQGVRSLPGRGPAALGHPRQRRQLPDRGHRERGVRIVGSTAVPARELGTFGPARTRAGRGDHRPQEPAGSGPRSQTPSITIPSGRWRSR